jgi:hypothetical protein
MKSKALKWSAALITVLVLTAGVSVQAQNWGEKDKKFSGVINAYTPQSSTGPYEVRGPWSLTLKRNSTRADFSAALNMQFSDGWVISKNGGDFDPTLRNAHTHHITLTDAQVSRIPNGFEVTGTAAFTLSGNPAPSTVSPSQLTIQVTGGSEVEFSNITLTFSLPGSNHFGTAPLPGVVRSVKEIPGEGRGW